MSHLTIVLEKVRTLTVVSIRRWIDEQHHEFVPHSLQHTFGTRLDESGAGAFTIMKLMGHSGMTVSQKYVHPSPESIERAVGRMEALVERKVLEVGMPASQLLVRPQ